jgi:hypothetical protein
LVNWYKLSTARNLLVCIQVIARRYRYKKNVMANTLNLLIFTKYYVRPTGKFLSFLFLYPFWRRQPKRQFTFAAGAAGSGLVQDRVHFHRLRLRRIDLHGFPVDGQLSECLREPMEAKIRPGFRKVTLGIGPDRTKPM